MPKIVFFGDSHFAQSFLSQSGRMIEKIAANNGYSGSDIINAGVGGDETADGIARISADVLAHSPDVCVVCFMTNDKKANVSVNDYKANLSDIIDTLQAASIKVVVMTPPAERGASGSGGIHDKNDEYVKAMGDVAKIKNCEFVDIYRELLFSYFKLGSSAFMGLYYDMVHIDSQGSTFVADYLNRDQFDGVFTV